MRKKHTYFRPTTAQQGHLLFETWETGGDVKVACRQIHVCPATFYYWNPRFEAGGYAALEKAESWYARLLTEAVTPTLVRQWMLE